MNHDKSRSRLQRAPNGADRDFVGIDDDFFVAIGPIRVIAIATDRDLSRPIATRDCDLSRLIEYLMLLLSQARHGTAEWRAGPAAGSAAFDPALHRPGPIVVFTVVASICRPASRKGRPSQTYVTRKSKDQLR